MEEMKPDWQSNIEPPKNVTEDSYQDGNSSDVGVFSSDSEYAIQEKKRRKKIIILAVGIATFFILGGGAIFAFLSYERNYKSVEIESVLPFGSNIVAKININPESEQFVLLESNLEKFPGYGILKRKIGDGGKDKTISQIIQDNISEKGLNFQDDIKSVVDDNVYVLIPDAGPFMNNIAEGTLLTFSDQKKRLAVKPDNEVNSLVLGEEDFKKADPMPADFMVASKIKDLEKAQKTLEKMRNGENYDFVSKKYGGHQYFEIKIKADTKGEIRDIVNYETTYHALLGGNWIFASKEDYIKQSISLKRKKEVLSNMFSEVLEKSLVEDEDYQKIKNSLVREGKSNLLESYYKLNFDKFFGKESCETEFGCPDHSQYIKYPENFIGGISVSFEEAGVEIITNSNEVSMKDVEVFSKSESMANKVPQVVDQKWTDVFSENSNVKNLYYSFKDNNLTDDGVVRLDKFISEIETDTKINLEKDFIDIINGNSAFMLFAKRDNYPSAAFAFEISDPERMKVTMGKLVDFIKTKLAGLYESQLQMYSSSGGPSIPSNLNPESKKLNEELQDQADSFQATIDAIKNSTIKEEDFSGGKLYSYEIPLPQEIKSLVPISASFYYSLENGKFIIGMDSGSIKSMMSDMSGGAYKSLGSSTAYQTATKYYNDQSYASFYMAMQGICNSVEHIAKNIYSQMPAPQTDCIGNATDCLSVSSYSGEGIKGVEDYISASLAFLKTINTIGVYKAIDGDSVITSVFLNIVEISKEEKDKAERIMEKM